MRTRFTAGEIYEGDFPGGIRRATVEEIWDDGRAGRLRFIDGGEEFTALCVQLHLDGKWRYISAQ